MMKYTKNATGVLGLATSLLMSACNNPADGTRDAEVADAVEKSSFDRPEGAVRYRFTDDSSITFVGSKKIGSSHSGGFKSFDGHFTLKDGEAVGNDHRVVIDMESTYSDNEKLTVHLKNADFFDVPNHPEAVFDVTGVEKGEDGLYSVSGNLTLRGQTKNITFPAQVGLQDEVATLKAEFNINRMDFGVSYQGVGDNFINEEVVIQFDLRASPESSESTD